LFVEGIRVLEASYDEVYTKVKGVLRGVENEKKRLEIQQ
jgi:hypothetical protein